MAKRPRAPVNPGALALAYAVFAVGFMLFSGRVLRAIARDEAHYLWLEPLRGWAFILLTTLGLWILLRRALSRLTRIALAAIAAEDRLRMALTAAGGLVWQMHISRQDGDPYWQVSGGLARSLGLPEGPMMAMIELASHIHPADRAAFDRWAEAQASAKTTGGEGLFRFRLAQGGVRWIKMVSDPDLSDKELRLGVAFDLTQQQEITQDFSEVIFGAELGTWRLDLATGELRINDRWAQLLGHDRAELEPMTAAKFYGMVHPVDLTALLDRQADRAKRGTYLFSDEIRMRHKSGHWVWILTRSRPVEFNDQGQPRILSGIHVDVSRRKALEAELNQERDFLLGLTRTSVSGILALDPEGVISFANHEAADILGQPEERMIGMTVSSAFLAICDLQGQPMDPALYPHALVMDGRQILRDHRMQVTLRDGRVKAISVNAAPMSLMDGRVQIVASLTDITAQLANEAALRAAAAQATSDALHDAMTGLPNRAAFEDHLAAALAQADASGSELCHVFLDMDNFKQVNDRFGHHVGDQLIRAAAARLTALCTPGQVLARVAGDEFTFLHPMRKGEAADPVLTRLASAFDRPFDLDGRQIYVTVSLGVSFYPGDAQTTGDLWINADLAMYEAKSRGRNQTVRYSPRLRERQGEEARIAQILQRALQARSFTVVLQPLMQLAAPAQMVGAEALLRCLDPELAGIGPAVFLPVAERNGLMRAIDLMVVDLVAEALAPLRAQGSGLRVSINLSPESLQHEDFGREVLAQLERGALGPSDVIFELTEGALVDLSAQARETLDLLHARGFELSADDFGTGYSSLAYLHRLQLSELKIDRSFVARLGDAGEPSDDIVCAILAMSKALALRVVAEGIETEAQADWLRRHGCGLGQGFHYGPGIAPEAFAARYLAA